MDRQGPPNWPRYQLTEGLIRTMMLCCLDRKEVANAHSVIGPAGIIYRMAFSDIWRDWSCQPEKQLSIG